MKKIRLLFFMSILSFMSSTIHADQDELGFTPYNGIYGTFSVPDEKDGTTQIMGY